MSNERVFTVLELNATVRELIQIAFPQSVWVCGEIQGLRPDRGGRHTYFELVQKEAEGENIVAKVKMALFAGRKPLIEKRIKEVEGGFQLKNDKEKKEDLISNLGEAIKLARGDNFVWFLVKNLDIDEEDVFKRNNFLSIQELNLSNIRI